MVGVARDIRVRGVNRVDRDEIARELVLDVRDLQVSYAGAVQALRGVSLAVPEGR